MSNTKIVLIVSFILFVLLTVASLNFEYSLNACMKQGYSEAFCRSKL